MNTKVIFPVSQLVLFQNKKVQVPILPPPYSIHATVPECVGCFELQCYACQ